MAAGLLISFTATAAPDKGAKKDPKRVFSRLDANADGKLTAEEFQSRKGKNEERRTKRFRKLDSNGDGTLTAAEYESGAAKKRRK
jgi:hypothetical protein